MAIVAGDIKYRLSGGGSNTDPAASLGGAESSTDAGSTIFDNVSSVEGAAGDVEYRCVYVKNTHGSLTYQGAKIWIQANTPSADTTVDIGLGTTAVGTGNEQTIVDEQTAPSGVTFAAAANEGAALSIGDIPAGHHKAVWIRRTVTAGAAAASDSFTLRSKGDTLP
jgi:hypothetical protein